MAGAGYKLFNTGDVLTAAQVNTYLQEQTVMVFANATARTTALSGVLAEGMMSYLQDTNAVEVYDGSAWVSIGSSGDITGVTAGTGISGGGTSGTVTITNSMATAIDAKGDLIVGTGADTFSRLAVGGTNGHVLTVDSGEATGVKWAAVGGGAEGWSVLNGSSGTALTGASTITVSGISNKEKLLVLISGASAGSNAYIGVRFNADGNNNYLQTGGNTLANANPNNIGQYTNVTSATAGGDRIDTGRMGNNAAATVSGAVRVSACKATTNAKQYIATSSGDATATGIGHYIQGVYIGTSAITSVSILSDVGNFDAGTVWVWGSDN